MSSTAQNPQQDAAYGSIGHLDPYLSAPRSSALLTDKYELTMLEAALQDGTAEKQCAFEVFTRRLPNERRYGVVAGTERVLRAIRDFVFTEAQFSPDLARTVADEAGVEVVSDLYNDSLGDAPADTYVGMMRWNTERTVEALR